MNQEIRPFEIIARHIPPHTPLFAVYVPHVTMVAKKALDAGLLLGLNEEQLRFVEEAALLHDLGILHVKEPRAHCHGRLPYVMHGVEGRRMLEAEGLPAHARVAENHVGVGITSQEIIDTDLPLPHRDMVPRSIEEKIICWADLFFSKIPGQLWREKSLDTVRKSISRYGEAPLRRFEELHALCTGS